MLFAPFATIYFLPHSPVLGAVETFAGLTVGLVSLRAHPGSTARRQFWQGHAAGAAGLRCPPAGLCGHFRSQLQRGRPAPCAPTGRRLSPASEERQCCQRCVPRQPGLSCRAQPPGEGARAGSSGPCSTHAPDAPGSSPWPFAPRPGRCQPNAGSRLQGRPRPSLAGGAGAAAEGRGETGRRRVEGKTCSEVREEGAHPQEARDRCPHCTRRRQRTPKRLGVKIQRGLFSSSHRASRCNFGVPQVGGVAGWGCSFRHTREPASKSWLAHHVVQRQKGSCCSRARRPEEAAVPAAKPRWLDARPGGSGSSTGDQEAHRGQECGDGPRLGKEAAHVEP